MQRIFRAIGGILLSVAMAAVLSCGGENEKYRKSMEQSQVHLDIFLDSLNKGDLARVSQQRAELFQTGTAFNELGLPSYIEKKSDRDLYDKLMHEYASALDTIKNTLESGQMSRSQQLQAIRAVRLEENCQRCHAAVRDPLRPE